MSARGADAAIDGANVNKMISDYAAQKREVADLSAAVLSLTKEIRALKDAQRKTTSANEQDAPPPPPTSASANRGNARSTRENGRTDLSTYDKSWPTPKRDWFFAEFRKREPARWKKWRANNLKAQLAALE